MVNNVIVAIQVAWWPHFLNQCQFGKQMCIPLPFSSIFIFPSSSILFRFIEISLSPGFENDEAKCVLRILALVSLSLCVILSGSFSGAMPVVGQ